MINDLTFDEVLDYLKQRVLMHKSDASKAPHPIRIEHDFKASAVQQCINGLKAVRKRKLKRLSSN